MDAKPIVTAVDTPRKRRTTTAAKMKNMVMGNMRPRRTSVRRGL